MSSRAGFLVLFLVCAAMPLRAQVPREIDAVEASPESYAVLLENDHVRVTEFEIEPGERESWHTHPPKVMYVLGSGTLRVTREDGTSMIATPQSGEVSWTEAVGLHYGENIGESTVRILMVEVKSAASPTGAG